MVFSHANSRLRYPKFINKLTGSKDEKRENGLRPCTQDIREFTVNTSSGLYVFVDTPGFDDTYRCDRDVLHMINEWLRQKYQGEVKLSGLIYMHRITDNRMHNSVCKNVNRFGQLCGANTAEHVWLVTTMWDTVRDQRIAASRVSQLEKTSWKHLMDAGAHHRKFENTPESAWDIIRDATGVSEDWLRQEETEKLKASFLRRLLPCLSKKSHASTIQMRVRTEL
ncbi:hypothetical protein SCLCIDRAFT_1217533 [Scleroderma citrinum Foug A]|uniref:Uncharacterized protein n=1 Tax=Scleroderma citrinum Foug A TaxID=1036808 RepID=A0A0C3A4I2_9AGAM|nr:hypothetical protein SCLCIDRAFT_1217533 [Scleroderma citrinum Foug A]